MLVIAAGKRKIMALNEEDAVKNVWFHGANYCYPIKKLRNWPHKFIR